MRRTLLLALLLIVPAALGKSASDYAPESETFSETFSSKVLKVYACHENNIDYVAYVVSWRGHEVVVAPLPGVSAEKTYQVGDAIRCRMSHSTRKLGTTDIVTTQFFLSSGGEIEQARLQAIEAAIKARPALREALPPAQPKAP